MNLNVEKIQIKRGAYEAVKDYVPLKGELVYCVDDRDPANENIVVGPSVKVGDGVKTFSQLNFMNYGPIFALIRSTCEQIVEQMLADAYEPAVVGSELSFADGAASVVDSTITFNELTGATVQDSTLSFTKNA